MSTLPPDSENGAPAPPHRPVESTIVRVANGLVTFIARHWLAIFNSAWGIYVGLPLLAPVLMHLGWTGPGRTLYAIYSFMCHQLPDHSYFLFGSTLTPLRPELLSAGMSPSPSLFEQRDFIGNAEIGYKVAICERDIAIYGSVLLFGLLFTFLRPRLRSISLRVYLLLLIPIAVDGLTQLFGLRESNWWLRSVTGAIFGTASALFTYPYVAEAMQEVLESELARKTSVRYNAS